MRCAMSLARPEAAGGPLESMLGLVPAKSTGGGSGGKMSYICLPYVRASFQMYIILDPHSNNLAEDINLGKHRSDPC